jgi:hypothetical protein
VPSWKGRAFGLARQQLARRKYVLYYSPFSDPEDFEAFRVRSREIEARHARQTVADVARLQEKYRSPIIGEAAPIRLVEMLARVIDPANRFLGCTSQLAHTLQVLDAMEAERAGTDMIFSALVHDLGKLSLLSGELPEYVEGNGRRPIGTYEPGVGLDHCVLQYAHGEIVYQRIGALVPDHIAWLLRYHDIVVKTCEPYLDARDREYVDAYYIPFTRYDRTFSTFHLPTARLEHYADVLEKYLPETITF